VRDVPAVQRDRHRAGLRVTIQSDPTPKSREWPAHDTLVDAELRASLAKVTSQMDRALELMTEAIKIKQDVAFLNTRVQDFTLQMMQLINDTGHRYYRGLK
jgi:hypothetical protein